MRESEANYVSPVGASMSCSPQPAALHIAPAVRLREFCLYDFARGEFKVRQIQARASCVGGNLQRNDVFCLRGWHDVEPRLGFALAHELAVML